MTDPFYRFSDAVVSACGKYRYTLEREWADGPTATFVMLNPSTANAFEDDPTIRRCRQFAAREGCGGMTIVNLFAWRATKPENLPRDVATRFGPLNADYVHGAINAGRGPVIAAWGSWRPYREPRNDPGAWLLERYPDLLCLGVTANGSPRHPLYLAGDTPLQPLRRAA